MTAHTSALSLLLPGVGWTLVDGDVMTAEKVISERGYAEEGSLKPSSVEWTMDDPTDKYRPTNPTALTYDGKGGRNMSLAYAADGQVRNTVGVVSWRPDQTPDFTASPLRGRRWVGVRGEGLLHRIGQWQDPLRSAMYRQRAGAYGANLAGYWPLEDAASSTVLTNAVPLGRPGTFSGVTLASTTGPLGSDPVVTVSQEGSLSGIFLSTPGTGWQIAFSFKLAALPGVAGDNAIMFWTTSNGYRWQVWVTSAAYRLQVYDASGTSVSNNYVTWGGGAEPNKWTTMRIKCDVSGGNLVPTMSWYSQFAYGGTIYTYSPTAFAGTPGYLNTWQQPGNSFVNGGAFGHVLGVAGVTDDMLSYSALASFNGYLGERAAARYIRLMDEHGLPWLLYGVANVTQPMGVQRPDTLMGLLEEIERTEGALIWDDRTVVRLAMKTRGGRYNQTVKAALTYPADIGIPLTEVIDDQMLANVVTVRNRDGGEETSRRVTGPLATANIGEYRKVIDVSVESPNDLDTIADWELARGTITDPRYSAVVLDLDQNPSLYTTAHNVEIGERITLTGRTPDPLDLYVIGILESFETHRRTVTWICRPNAAFTSGIYSDAGSRYDSASTTLATAATTTATTLALTTSDKRDVWSTTSLPYSCMLGGERVTVTAMTAPAGTGPYTQTATVTRSVNGIIKAQTVGTRFGLADPVRYAR